MTFREYLCSFLNETLYFLTIKQVKTIPTSDITMYIKQYKTFLVLIIAGGSLSVVVVGSVNCHRDLLVQQVERDLITTDIQNIFLENPKHYFNNLTINYLLLVHAESPAGDPRAWFCTGD